MELGQLELAEERIRKLWTMAERMGLNHLLGGIFHTLSNILSYRGCLTEARDFGEREIKWSTANGEQYFGVYARLYLSMTEYLAGDYLAAEKQVRYALEMLGNNPGLLPFAQALLARSLRGQGRIHDAISCAREAYVQLEAIGQVQDGEPTIRLAFAECLVASSDLSEARQVIAKAMKRLSKQASNIDNLEWRHSFLNRIPEHRSILELARELGVASSSSS
jgi:tetratricopeptide (TPR) repeat protein